jgi:exodeoxyribonuclease V beta subunit
MLERPPFDVTLAGAGLIEAGAGTGKTWTITALVLRLLLEQNLEIGQILVVTYTRAATGELRGRIRNRLIQALAAFEAGGYGTTGTKPPSSPFTAFASGR